MDLFPFDSCHSQQVLDIIRTTTWLIIIRLKWSRSTSKASSMSFACVHWTRQCSWSSWLSQWFLIWTEIPNSLVLIGLFITSAGSSIRCLFDARKHKHLSCISLDQFQDVILHDDSQIVHIVLVPHHQLDAIWVKEEHHLWSFTKDLENIGILQGDLVLCAGIWLQCSQQSYLCTTWWCRNGRWWEW